MKRAAMGFIVAALLAGGGAAQQKKQAEVDLQAALRTETVDGDLKGAIQRYQAIVAKYKDDRAVAATALVHMAECYRKQGDAEARRVYERVVRDYADQKEAVAVARAQLRGAENVKGDRAVWTGRKVDLFGRVSPDGRWLTYVDWGDAGSLCLHDLQSGADYPLTGGYLESSEAGFSIFSRDGKQVAYSWSNGNHHYELRTATLAGTNLVQPRRLFDAEDIKSISPHDWSPDGKWVAVHITRQDLTGQIALVSFPSGALRVLKSVDWRGPTKIFFSPDGKHVAYGLPVGEVSEQTDIFVMAIDGSREIAAVSNPSQNIVMGWSPDGKHLLFASNRAGTMSLWALPFDDGKAQGGEAGEIAPRIILVSGIDQFRYLVCLQVRGRQLRSGGSH